MALLSSGSLTTQFGGGLTIRRSRPPTAAAELRALGIEDFDGDQRQTFHLS